MSFERAFTIQVLDVNEYVVTAAADNNTTNNVVAENAPVDSLVGITAFASDDDGSNNAVSYSLQDATNSAKDAGGRFKIDPVSGVVSVATSNFDFEQTTSYSSPFVPRVPTDRCLTLCSRSPSRISMNSM